MDVRVLHRVFARHGYRWEVCNRRPIPYRKLLGAQERDEVSRMIRARGEDPAGAFQDDYFVVDLLLARPAEHDVPLQGLLAELDGGL